MGRPPYQPSEENRKQVLKMAGFGLTHDQIAKVMGISDETLRKYFEEELATGAATLIFNVADNLYNVAVSDRPNAMTAAIFFLKTRGKWSEITKHEISGANGGALQFENKVIDLKALTDEELENLETALLPLVEAREGDDDAGNEE